MIRRRLLFLYMSITLRLEIVVAWLLTVSAHGDHLGHPFI